MELNEKLLSLRKKNKLTQAQVAEALDVSRQAISNWETGAVLPSTDNLIALSRLYQVPADHLLNDDSDLIPVPVEEKEVDKKEETPPEPAKSTTYSKLDILRKHGVIILLYLPAHPFPGRFDLGLGHPVPYPRKRTRCAGCE